jgi:opacity protein-like surface antigen
MKRFLLSGTLPLAMACMLATTNTQAQSFEEGTSAIAIGYGVGTFMGALNSTFDTYTDVTISSMGPLYVKYEYAVTDKIGLGMNIAYATNSWSYKYSDGLTNTVYQETTDRSTYSILARLNWHFGNSDKFDPYAGIGLGYRDAKWTYETTNPNGTNVELKSLMPLGMELTIGARYFFTDNIGLYAELGAAKSVAQFGLAARF